MTKKWIMDSENIVESVEETLQAAYEENKDIHDILDAGDPIEISSIKEERGSYKIERSEILFWVDRNAYYEEMELCLLKYHEDVIENIKNSELKPAFRDLVDAIKKKRIVPFVGAGASKPLGFPLWGDALSEILTRIDGTPREPIQSEIDNYNFLHAAQLLWDADSTQVKNYIRNKFAKQNVAGANMVGPITLLSDISEGCIITTNFDSVIEEAIGRGNFEGYMHGLQQGNKFVPRLVRGERCILKLHGDAEDYETYVLTEEQYKEGYGDPHDFSKPLPKALRQIYLTSSLLFLGCSLESDKTLELFSEVKSDAEFEVPDHFALLPEPSGGETKNHKEGRLIELNIRPIWYPAGKHDFVEKYLRFAIHLATGRLMDF